MKIFLKLLLCLLLFTAGCAEQPGPKIIIVPQKCQIEVGEEFPVSLEGSNMPSGAKILWSATKGLVNPTSGVTVIYTAPQELGPVIITASLETDTVKNTTTLMCEIIAPPTNLPAAVNTIAPTADTDISTSVPTATLENSVAITEVMAATCDHLAGPNQNEYIELYNYGNADVDINGWWLAVNGGGVGTPDRIVSWDSKNHSSLGSNVITNTTVIPSGRFAIVLSPIYNIGQGINFMPYTFAKGTIILTLGNSDYLGNDSTGMLGNSDTLTAIVLYKGSETNIDEVISTYGTPFYRSSPQNIQDGKKDGLPLLVSDCYSVERIVPSGRDMSGNWRAILNGNPGQGDYNP
jgi:hypothetical protein